MDKLPVFKKCCFCIPLRYGLLTWGYIKLGLALFVGCVYILLLTQLTSGQDGTMIALTGMLLAIEITIHIVFIIGGHEKNVKLLRIYYYYAIFIWVSIILTFIVGSILVTLTMWAGLKRNGNVTAILISSFLSFCFSIVIQTFFILSIRSEIIKLRGNCPYRFVKNDFEPEGVINSVKDEQQMIIDNSTIRIS